jgi:superfamily II DNA or RNA helicase
MTKQNELQKEVVDKAIEFYKTDKKGYLDLAMRFGKTKTTIDILNILCKNGEVLIAYPDNKLRDVWIKECQTWGYDNSNITYVNFSSVKKHTSVNYDFFIIDEFHSASENERESCFEIISNSNYTLGLSGTVSEETKMEWGIKEIAQYSTLQGIEDGILADYQITVHCVELDTKQKQKNKKGVLKTEKQMYDAYTWVIESMKREGRNFMHLALSRNRLSLSSIGKMNYLRNLLNKLQDKRVIVFTGLAKVADEIGIPSYHSKSKSDESFSLFQEGKCNHLALAAMGKMGVTYTKLDSVILMNFTYNAEETSQILNRAIKLDYKNKIADLHVVCLNEPAELKKVKESLSMLDQSKIKFL